MGGVSWNLVGSQAGSSGEFHSHGNSFFNKKKLHILVCWECNKIHISVLLLL